MLAVDRVFHLVKGGGRPLNARLSRWRALANSIMRRREQLKKLDDRELLQASLEVRWRAKAGESLLKLMPEAYALVVEASSRTTGMTHYPVQVMGGIGLYEGGIAEMQTGEGKTLTAVLPAYLRALPGRGYHVITVNDYLAKRDCEEMAPIYAALGMSVGCVQTEDQTDQRRQAFGPTPPGHDAEHHLGERHARLGPVVHDAIPAGERELHAAAHAEAVDHRDRGKG